MKPNDAISHHLERRRRLAQAIAEGVALVPTAPERLRNRDTHFPYRFDSHFYYLSGFAEPEAALVLTAQGKASSFAATAARSARSGTASAMARKPRASASAFDEAYPIAALDETWPSCSRTSLRCTIRSAPTPSGTRASCAG